jgi:glutamyl-tRNA reductase
MAVWALGINHTTAPLDLRGRFAFAIDQIEPTLASLRQNLQGRLARQPEAAILSTCNRTEIYCAAPEQGLEPTLDWLAHAGGVSPGLLRSHAYTLSDGLAARHAFRVASGLDSMVLGEAQILGQLKDAVRWAPRSTSCSSARSRWPRKCARPPRSARTPSAWPRLRCGWPASCSKTWARSRCYSSAPAR